MKKNLRTPIILIQKNWLWEKSFCTQFQYLTDEKTEGKGLSVTRKSARLRLLLGLQTPSCHA